MSLDIDSLRSFVNDSLALWKVPGAAVVVVQGDEVVICEGFGLRDLEGRQPVTARTLFAIGSSTKAFTAFAFGLLVDEGKLEWDKPVREFLPTFKLYDASASQRVTPRDLLSHRTGLPRHDLVWYNSSRSRQEIVAALQYLEPNKDLREVWQYQNMMYLTAGVLVEHLSGQPWEAFVRSHIFEPLGMERSNFSVDVMQQSDDFALPYQEKKRQVERMPFRKIDLVGPAGAINASVEELAAWLRVQVNGGRLGERQVISAGNLSQMHTPQMVINGPRKYKELLHSSYGLGWFIQPYRGADMIHHGGNIDGFSALVALLPEQNAGVAVLSNLNGTPLPAIVTYRICDQLLGLESVDWNGRFHPEHEEILAAMDKGQEKTASDRQEGHPPAHPLANYAGEYEHPGYGVLAIELRGEELKGFLNNIEFDVKPYHYEVFQFDYGLIDLHMLGTFTTDTQGNVSRLSLPLEPMVKEIVFERIADRRLNDPAFLGKLTGRFILMGIPLIVSLKGQDQLIASVSGQPAMELVPYRDTTFHVKGVTGVSLTFKLGESGTVEEIEFVQPGAVLTARRSDEQGAA